MLHAAPETLLLGPVEPVAEYKHLLRLRNVSTKPIHISEFVSSCTCAEVSPPSLVIPARGAEDVVLTLDLFRYVTPGQEPIIRGEVQISPVISEELLEGWTIALNVVRPLIMVAPAGTLELGTVYSHETAITSANLVFISTELQNQRLTAQSSSPSVRSVTLVPVLEESEYYKRHRLELLLSEHGRPYGHHRIDITISGPPKLTVTIPCHVQYDEGLRLTTSKRPPTILRVGDEVRWSLQAYRVGGDLQGLDVTCDDQFENASFEVE